MEYVSYPWVERGSGFKLKKQELPVKNAESVKEGCDISIHYDGCK